MLKSPTSNYLSPYLDFAHTACIGGWYIGQIRCSWRKVCLDTDLKRSCVFLLQFLSLGMFFWTLQMPSFCFGAISVDSRERISRQLFTASCKCQECCMSSAKDIPEIRGDTISFLKQFLGPFSSTEPLESRSDVGILSPIFSFICHPPPKFSPYVPH